MAVLWAARHDPVLRLDKQEQRLWLEGSAARLFTEYKREGDLPQAEDQKRLHKN